MNAQVQVFQSLIGDQVLNDKLEPCTRYHVRRQIEAGQFIATTSDYILDRVHAVVSDWVVGQVQFFDWFAVLNTVRQRDHRINTQAQCLQI